MRHLSSCNVTVLVRCLQKTTIWWAVPKLLMEVGYPEDRFVEHTIACPSSFLKPSHVPSPPPPPPIPRTCHRGHREPRSSVENNFVNVLTTPNCREIQGRRKGKRRTRMRENNVMSTEQSEYWMHIPCEKLLTKQMLEALKLGQKQ